MRMQINNHLYFVSIFLDEMFDWMDNRIVVFVGRCPFSIRIGSRKFGPWIAMNNPINIDHGDNFEDKIIQQNVSLLIIGY